MFTLEEIRLLDRLLRYAGRFIAAGLAGILLYWLYRFL